MSDSGGSNEVDDAVDSDAVDVISRRQWLGLIGVGVTSLAGAASFYYGSDDSPPESPTDGTGAEPTATPTETPADETVSPTQRSIEFDRTVDAVDDLGLDPSGEIPVEEPLSEALAEPGTLVVFPSGTYRFDGSVALKRGPLGLLGKGDVTFTPAPGFVSLLFDGQTADLDDVLIENVDIDVRAPDTTAGIRLSCQEHFHVQDVRYLGRGTSDSPEGTTSAFLLSIRSEDGAGTLRGAVARKGSRIDGYKRGNGRIGVWVGWSNKGTVRIEDCDFREFGNNGIYASRTPGQVQVVDSYFLNNNASSVRVGGKGSYVKNCTVEIDLEKYTGPPLGDISSGFNTRAIVVEQGLAKPGPVLPAGAEIIGCTVFARHSPKSQSVIEQSPQARSLTIRDTTISCDIDGTPAVRRGPPGAISYRPDRQMPPLPHWTRLQNVTISGRAAGGAAIDLRRAPQSAVENCSIVQPGADRDGVLLAHSPQSRIEGSDVRTDGYPVVVTVDTSFSPDRSLLCLDTETRMESRSIADGERLTDSPALFRVHNRNSRTDVVCLNLDPGVATRQQLESLSGPLRIGLTGLEDGQPLGRLRNRTYP